LYRFLDTEHKKWRDLVTGCIQGRSKCNRRTCSGRSPRRNSAMT